jgi:hypothetical protein
LGWAAQTIADEWDGDQAKRDTPLGDLFTDAYRAWTGTDVALEARGFLDDPLPRGPIVGADVFRSMSFGVPKGNIVRPYKMVTFKATGSALQISSTQPKMTRLVRLRASQVRGALDLGDVSCIEHFTHPARVICPVRGKTDRWTRVNGGSGEWYSPPVEPHSC